MKNIFVLIGILMCPLISHCCQKTIDPGVSFVASTAVPFSKLLSTAMDIMDRDMSSVSSDQSNELVFLEKMIAHHEGAINMALAVSQHTKNKETANYAISIIVNQKNEIAFMKTLIKNLKKTKK